VRVLTYPFHVDHAFQSLTLTNKKTDSLSLQVYYGNAAKLERVFQVDGLRPLSKLRCVLTYTKPPIGALARILKLQLRIDNQFEYDGGYIFLDLKDKEKTMNQ
jgi:hypothetical protein